METLFTELPRETVRKVRIGPKVSLRGCTERSEKSFFAAPHQHKVRSKCCVDPISDSVVHGVLGGSYAHRLWDSGF
jgi:hypothetical protein